MNLFFYEHDCFVMHTWGCVQMTQFSEMCFLVACNSYSTTFGLPQNSIVPTPSPFIPENHSESLGKCDGRNDWDVESQTFGMGRRPTPRQLTSAQTLEWNAEPFFWRDGVGCG
ncbi:hypothetical protein CDAR_457711 [Caerostris darwini]|uniref:Uncharacterized protein n=1 Tax=Caerostris darwini TaxID=1538125 RepID=A0AAV4RLB8_9ARAC|nr:hypothetical protein CDAR_457711 [Caerostris darwini]